jgi:hypothetical protein
LGSGAYFTRDISFSSNLDVSDFTLTTNTDRAALAGVPGSLTAGTTQHIAMGYTAPIVSRRTAMDIRLSPGISLGTGTQALERVLRIKVIVLPAIVSWSPPEIHGTLLVQKQVPAVQTVFVTSNYDVANVRLRTADIGLTPILSPVNAVDLKAGVPQPVQVRMCPGYAPTTYFLGISAYQGNQPLTKRLRIRLKVEDDGTGLPPPGGSDPCAIP